MAIKEQLHSAHKVVKNAQEKNFTKIIKFALLNFLYNNMTIITVCI